MEVRIKDIRVADSFASVVTYFQNLKLTQEI